MLKTHGVATILALVIAFTGSVSVAQAAKGTKKKGEEHIHGTVMSVEHKGSSGSFTIKSHKRSKKTQGTAGKSSSKEHKLTFDEKTKFESGHSKQTKPASAKSLHKGEHVVVEAKGDHAIKVTVHQHKKKKKKV